MTTIPKAPRTFGDTLEHDKDNPTVAAIALHAARKQAARSLVLAGCWPLTLEFYVGNGVVAWWADERPDSLFLESAEAASVIEQQEKDRKAFRDHLREKYGPVKEFGGELTVV